MGSREATKPASAAEEAQPQQAGAGKMKKTKKEKRKRVMRDRQPEKFIHFMIVHPSFLREIPEEDLATSSEEFRASYAKRKARDEKWVAYNQDLIDQYLINGYAESVWEVEITDDEDDGDDDS